MDSDKSANDLEEGKAETDENLEGRGKKSTRHERDARTDLAWIDKGHSLM